MKYPPIPCRASKAAVQAAAEQYAQKIGFKLGDDILDLVKALGGRVLYRDFFHGEQRESIHVRSMNDFDIFVPTETSVARDRFTIAHELGHLLLHYPRVLKQHPGEPTVEMTADRYPSDQLEDDAKRCEWESNWFAAALLMPSNDFTQAWTATEGDAVAVARKFWVSVPAAENRAKSLSLIK